MIQSLPDLTLTEHHVLVTLQQHKTHWANHNRREVLTLEQLQCLRKRQQAVSVGRQSTTCNIWGLYVASATLLTTSPMPVAT